MADSPRQGTGVARFTVITAALMILIALPCFADTTTSVSYGQWSGQHLKVASVSFGDVEYRFESSTLEKTRSTNLDGRNVEVKERVSAVGVRWSPIAIGSNLKASPFLGGGFVFHEAKWAREYTDYDFGLMSEIGAGVSFEVYDGLRLVGDVSQRWANTHVDYDAYGSRRDLSGISWFAGLEVEW